MSRRPPSDARHSQIVESTLALLADTPIDRITTRRVARAVGISQLALLRHFRSRERILEAVVARTREDLERLAAEILGRKDAPLASVEALVRGVVDYVSRNPGTLRLLFRDAGSGECAPYRRAIEDLESAQRSLAAELLRRAERSAEVRCDVDPDRAAQLLIASLQGLLLEWQRSGRRAPLDREAAAMLAFWAAALEAGEPARRDGGEAEGEGAPLHASAIDDLRDLEAPEPMERVLAATAQLAPGGTYAARVPRYPRLLLPRLEERGLLYEVIEEPEGTALVRVRKPA
jgi:TetR/AcrR family transcriptional regulator